MQYFRTDLKVLQGLLRFLTYPLSVITLAVLVSAAGSFSLSSPNAHAAPFPSCETSGLLYQYPNGTDTTVYSIDMVTGQSNPPAPPPTPTPQIDGRTINATGYNVKDNFVYGWDNAADSLVRIHSDFSVEEIAINGFTTTTNIIIGDVDENGYYWFIVGNGAGNGQTYHAVDLNSGTTTVDLVPGIGTGTTSGIPPNHSAGADWAYVPGGSGLYRVMHDSTNDQGRLMVFDRNSGAFSSLGLIDQSQLPHTDLKEGAFYADKGGYLYASDNDDGNIYRIDIQNTTASLFSTGPSSASNDGARCANAAIPIDFSDAPNSYGTLLSSDGPRHGVAGYTDNNTAPLMLGKKIDIEPDGFDSTNADGDDTNNIEDETGVQHIVATPGTPTPLSVPVTVTNNHSTEATLAGWVDLDNSGTFEVGERVTKNIPANSGVSVYELNFPTTTFNSDTYARFRVFQGAIADPQPTGSATGGEVEDYLVQVGMYEVVKSSQPPDGSAVSPGDTITYTLTVNNTGLTDLIDLTIHDNLTDVLDDATLEGNPVVSPASAGTAVVNNDELEFVFTGDVLAGQTVTVTYSIKVNDPDLGNGEIRNMVLAAHSNCHPTIENSSVTVSHSDCSTEHTVDTTATAKLADTGQGITTPISLAISLVGIGSSLLYIGRKRFAITYK